MFYLLFYKYDFPPDGSAYIGVLGAAMELAAILAFTAFGLLLVLVANATQNGARHWFLNWLAPIGLLLILALIAADEVMIVGTIQAFVFSLSKSLKSSPWRRFQLRDIMLAILLIGLTLAVFTQIPIRVWNAWIILVLIGVVAGGLTFGADWVAKSNTIVGKIAMAVLLPYSAILVLLLSLHHSRHQWCRPVFWTLSAIVTFPVVLMIGDLLYRVPKPPELGTGFNALALIINAGDSIGDSTIRSDPPRQVDPPLRPIPTSQIELEEVVSAYAEQMKVARSKLNDPVWLTVNYEWKDFDDFRGRIPQRNALCNLDRALIADARLAMLDGRTDDAVDSFTTVLDLNRHCGQGGLPMDTKTSMGLDEFLLFNLADYRGKFSAEHSRELSRRFFDQSNSYESIEVLKSRRRAWEDRVLRWHQQLAIRYFDLWRPTRNQMSQYEYRSRFHMLRMRLMSVELALDSFRRSNLRLPDSLTELQPEFFATLPSDPYSKSDSGFIYKKTAEGYLLYSVGENGLDDGGATAPMYQSDITLESAMGRINWNE